MRNYHGPPGAPSMCVCLCLWVHTEGNGQLQVLFPGAHLPFLFLRQGHLLPPEGLQTELSLLTNRPQGSIDLQPPALELHLGTTISVYFTWLLGAKLKPLCLQGKHFNTWVICPAPSRQHWSHDLAKQTEPGRMKPAVFDSNTERVPWLPPLLFIFFHSPRENSEDKYSLQQTSQMTSKWEKCKAEVNPETEQTVGKPSACPHDPPTSSSTESTPLWARPSKSGSFHTKG